VDDLDFRLTAVDKYDHYEHQIAGHSDGQIALLSFVLEAVILGDDDIRICKSLAAISNEMPWSRLFLALSAGAM
jgi:hypothetical protein